MLKGIMDPLKIFKNTVILLKVLAGGRGKGRFANYPKGGVQLLFSAEEIEEAAKGMIGMFNGPSVLYTLYE